MSNLLSTAEGRNAVLLGQQYVLRRMLGRFFKRNAWIDFDDWENTGFSSLATVLGELNSDWDDQLLDIYRLLGTIGGLDVSVAETNIYVDSNLGSDTEGDGSSAHPYQTIWFLRNLPRVIQHPYRIIIRNSVNIVNESSNGVLDYTFEGNGSLAFIGQGAETVHGSYTVDSGGLLPRGTGGRYLLSTSSGASHNKWFRIDSCTTTPGFVGRASPIWYSENSLNSIFLNYYSSSSSVIGGDTYSTVTPSPSLSFTSLKIECKSPIVLNGTAGGSCRVVFANLNIHAGAFTSSFVVRNTEVYMPFCLLSANSKLTMYDSVLNSISTAPYDNDIGNYTGTTITNISMYSTYNPGTIYYSGSVSEEVDAIDVHGVCSIYSFNTLNNIYCSHGSRVEIHNSGACAVEMNLCSAYIRQCLLYGQTASEGAAVYQLGGDSRLALVTVFNSVYAMKLFFANTYVENTGYAYNASYYDEDDGYQYCFAFGGPSMSSANCSGVTEGVEGGGGGYYSYASLGGAAMPATRTLIDDTYGSRLYRGNS